MSIANEIEKEIANIHDQVKSGALTKEQGEELLKELNNLYTDLSGADKEILARNVAAALSVLAKLA